MNIPVRFAAVLRSAAPALILFFALPAFSQSAPIQLPKPQTTGGAPLMQTLQNRQTVRVFSEKPLPMQVLSNLLWAGFGVNRPHATFQPGSPTIGRTAPSGRNTQDIQLYVVMAQGAYVYDAEHNQLRQVSSADLRSKIGGGGAAHCAATIVFVAPAKDEFAQVDTGFIGQNIYLFGASEGLNVWFYAFHNQDVGGALGLSADQAPLYGESVGYPPAK